MYAFCLPFEFLWFFLFTLNILLYAFTYTLASYIAHNDKITLCPSFVHIRTQAKNINCLCIFADISRYFFSPNPFTFLDTQKNAQLFHVGRVSEERASEKERRNEKALKIEI